MIAISRIADRNQENRRSACRGISDRLQGESAITFQENPHRSHPRCRESARGRLRARRRPRARRSPPSPPAARRGAARSAAEGGARGAVQTRCDPRARGVTAAGLGGHGSAEAFTGGRRAACPRGGRVSRIAHLGRVVPERASAEGDVGPKYRLATRGVRGAPDAVIDGG